MISGPPIPGWIDCYYSVKVGDTMALRLREPPVANLPAWRVCLDAEPGPDRVLVRVVEVVQQPGGHLSAKVEVTE